MQGGTGGVFLTIRNTGNTPDRLLSASSPLPRAAELHTTVRDGDVITFDIPGRSVHVEVSDDELARRRAEQDERGWQPVDRDRQVSQALRIFARFAQSADKGAARKVD